MPYYPAISLLVVHPAEMHSCIHHTICALMIIAAPFVTGRKLDIIQMCISSGLINKLRHNGIQYYIFHIMDMHATMWMKFRKHNRSGKSQTPVSIYYPIHVDCSDRQDKCVLLAIRRMVTFGWAQSLKGTTKEDFGMLVRVILDLGVDYLCVFCLWKFLELQKIAATFIIAP